MTIKIEDCPFCEHVSELKQCGNALLSVGHYVHCTKCNAGTGAHSNLDEAVSEWNSRVKIPVLTAPPELAELQATIARLTVENDQLQSNWDEIRKMREAHGFESWASMLVEIERLNGRQGEPVVKLHCNISNVKITVNEDGSYTIDPTKQEEPVAWMTECIKGLGIGAIEQSDGEGSTKNMEYWTSDFPVYRSQPAPVSVIDLLREAYECGDRNVFGTDLDDRIKNCLDKVKELNG